MSKIYPYNQFVTDISQLHWKLLESKHKWWPDLILGVMRGGAVPAVYLSHVSGIPCESFVWQTRDGGDKEHRYDLIDGFVGTDKKNVLILDDINDSGVTFQTIWDDWTYFSVEDIQKHVKFACLFDRHSTKFAADYNIHHLTTDEWVIFPWEQST